MENVSVQNIVTFICQIVSGNDDRLHWQQKASYHLMNPFLETAMDMQCDQNFLIAEWLKMLSLLTYSWCYQ